MLKRGGQLIRRLSVSCELPTPLLHHLPTCLPMAQACRQKMIIDCWTEHCRWWSWAKRDKFTSCLGISGAQLWVPLFDPLSPLFGHESQELSSGLLFLIHFFLCSSAFCCSLFLLSFSITGPISYIFFKILFNQHHYPKSACEYQTYIVMKLTYVRISPIRWPTEFLFRKTEKKKRREEEQEQEEQEEKKNTKNWSSELYLQLCVSYQENLAGLETRYLRLFRLLFFSFLPRCWSACLGLDSCAQDGKAGY